MFDADGKPITPKEEPVVEEEIPTEEVPATEEEAKRKGIDFDAEKALASSNIAYNFLRSKGKIEDYELQVPKYKRYMHEDLTAPLMREADKQAAVMRHNINTGHGTRGQKTSYMTQADAKILDAKHRVQTEEIGRRLGTYNQNVGLANMEVNAATQEAQRRREALRMARAKRRSFEAASVKEATERADINRQERYMRERDARLFEMEKYKSRLVSDASKHYNIGGLSFEDGYIKNVDDEKTVVYDPASYNKGKIKKSTGSKSIKVKKSRYKKK